MKKKKIVICLFFLITILAAACNPTVQIIEVTRIVPQTTVITQIVTKLITLTPEPTNIFLSPTPAPSETPVLTPAIDMASQDGKVVVVQYYTLLGLHLYEQAYQILSKQIRSRVNINTYLEGVKSAFIFVKVFYISPAKDEFIKYGGVPPSDIDDWYYVEIYAEGENGMSGSQVNGFQKLYVRLALENNEWKIADIDSSVH